MSHQPNTPNNSETTTRSLYYPSISDHCLEGRWVYSPDGTTLELEEILILRKGRRAVDTLKGEKVHGGQSMIKWRC